MSSSTPTPSSHWRPSLAGRQTRSPSRLRLAALAAGALAVAGALAAWVLIPRPFPRPLWLPLCLTEYDKNLPVRAWVRQDSEALGRFFRTTHHTPTSQQHSLILGELDALSRLEPGDTIVVYLNAYALTNSRGELAVLAVDDRVDRPDSWVPLRDILRLLRECRARHKLLLLDVMQPLTDPARGILVQDAAEKAWPLLDEAVQADPHLAVLCACSPGQVSLAAEEQGHTAFAHFLCAGLRGDAEGAGNGRHDRRVTLSELAAYVTVEVDRWALRQQGQRQTPHLFSGGEDFPLAGIEPQGGEAAADTDYPDWLREAWKVHDDWWQDETFRHSPDVFAGLESALLRAERQWRAGVSQQEVANDFHRRLRQRQLPPPPGAPASLAEALQRRMVAAPDPQVVVELRSLAGRSAARPASGARADEEEKKLAADSESLLKQYNGKPLELSCAVLEAAQKQRGREGFRFLTQLLSKAGVPEYPETRFLASVADLPAAGDDWPAEAVLAGLSAVRAAEGAAVGDLQDEAWVHPQRQRADQLRRRGEALLFGTDAAERSGAQEPLEEAVRVYEAIRRDRALLHEGRRCRDEALVLLPGFVAYLDAAGEPELEAAWEKAVAAAAQMREILAGPPQAGQLRRLADRVEEWRNDPSCLKRLRQPLDRKSFQRLIDRSTAANVADANLMSALLETPWPTAEQRATLWDARRNLAAALDRKSRSHPSLEGWDGARGAAEERRRAVQRARHSFDLLRLQGGQGLEKLEKALGQAGELPAEDRLAALADELRKAWSRRSTRTEVAPP